MQGSKRESCGAPRAEAPAPYGLTRTCRARVLVAVLERINNILRDLDFKPSKMMQCGLQLLTTAVTSYQANRRAEGEKGARRPRHERRRRRPPSSGGFNFKSNMASQLYRAPGMYRKSLTLDA
ncbi:hypothetical protein EVAR_8722_1 [Eumeta japonica]|uniref:Uncharacterized protein n=1 Tax=Eumeta variegata TaxID=151549 RepID=A0A4C1XNC3_EUMVA|nr:hypothetical protein EVAR_8722_1 [Eumeta japonica]